MRTPPRLCIFVFCILAFCLGKTFAATTTTPTVDSVSLVVISGELRADWPDKGVVAIRRTNTIAPSSPLSVAFTIGGSAQRNVDYLTSATNTLTIPAGQKEVWVEFSPVNRSNVSLPKTITLTLLPSTSYSINAPSTLSSVTLDWFPSSRNPSRKAAIRFLNQAAFGPDGDLQNVDEVVSLGFDKWISAQFSPSRPIGLLQPYLVSLGTAAASADKATAWWNQAMNNTSSNDALRQRIGFALSEIFVISDQFGPLGQRPVAMANYYDMLLQNAFGNFRDLLFSVGTHPCMGAYLSHLQNAKGNPAKGTFADENFAREIMQLFSIGLWQLNPDGTRVLDSSGQPIPTYDNTTIANMARVMTGFSFGGPKATGFWAAPENYTSPMKMWDAYHDLGAKMIISGIALPARTASKPDVGTAGMADYNAAIDALFLHPNTAPFFSKQLIQKLVTSNPSGAYVTRVAKKFVNNGSGVRGDLKAVIKAVLLDTEARDPKMLTNPKFGKLKEPYLRSVNLARALNAESTDQNYALTGLSSIHFQQPLSAPNVFNFFKPGYSPAGPINDAGLVAPEFQILNAVTALAIPNYYLHSIQYGFNRSVSSNTAQMVLPHLEAELALANDVPALMRRLDLILTGGTLPNTQHQIIREAVEGISPTLTNWKEERVRMAIYLIASSPDSAVLR